MAANARRPVALADAVPVVPVALRAQAVVVLVVSDHRMAGRPEVPPGGLVGCEEAVQRASLVVLEVAQRQHRRERLRSQKVGGQQLLAGAGVAKARVVARVARPAGDVAGGGDQRRRLGPCRRGRSHGQQSRQRPEEQPSPVAAPGHRNLLTHGPEASCETSTIRPEITSTSLTRRYEASAPGHRTGPMLGPHDKGRRVAGGRPALARADGLRSGRR
jgi:hypothetical protein